MMITPILDHWVTIFQTRLQENTDDGLKLKVVKKLPFQDDPIRQSPYLVIGENEQLGIKPENLGEIGGSSWWIVNLYIKAAPSPATTPDRAYYLVDLLSRRITYTIREMSLPGQQVEIPGLYLFNRDWHVIQQVKHKVYGGEREWLSYVEINFFQYAMELGPHPYGKYPGDFEYA